MNKKGNILLTILIVVGILAASVGGYFWWQGHKSGVNPKPPNYPETQNWKTYDSATHGFHFQYPPDLQTAVNDRSFSNENENSVHLFSKELINPGTSIQRREIFILITPLPASGNVNLDSISKNYFGILKDKERLKITYESSEQFKLGSYDVLKAVYTPIPGNPVHGYRQEVSYWISDGKYVVHVLYSKENPELTKKTEELVSKILSTFKFIQ